MKKTVFTALAVLLLTFLFGCAKPQQIYGTYTFDKLVFVSPLVSLTPEIIEAEMSDVRFTFQKNLFEIDSPDKNFRIQDPVYKVEKMDGALTESFEKAAFGMLPIENMRDKIRYTVFDGNKEETGFYVFLMDTEVWLASYTDNTADDSDVFLYVYQIKK